MRSISLVSILICAALQVRGADTLPQRFQKLFQEFPSKNGDVIVEIRGDPEADVRDAVMAFFPATGKRTILVAEVETYVMNAEVSDDGRFIVLQYHVSSGGWFEAFERTKSGYRKLFDNGFAVEQVLKGNVAGFSEKDLPRVPSRNMYCGLYLAQAPPRMIFTFWHSIDLTYSLKTRRFTEWERTLLQYQTSSGDGSSAAGLHLDELSGGRGIALTAWESKDNEVKMNENLITFPKPAERPDTSATATHFSLKSGTKDFVKLVAKKVVNESEEGGAKWEVEVSGAGSSFDTLQEKLGSLWKSFVVTGKNDSTWPSPTKFIADP